MATQVFFIFTPIPGISWSNLTTVIFFQGVGSTTNQITVLGFVVFFRKPLGFFLHHKNRCEARCASNHDDRTGPLSRCDCCRGITNGSCPPVQSKRWTFRSVPAVPITLRPNNSFLDRVEQVELVRGFLVAGWKLIGWLFAVSIGEDKSYPVKIEIIRSHYKDHR